MLTETDGAAGGGAPVLGGVVGGVVTGVVGGVVGGVVTGVVGGVVGGVVTGVVGGGAGLVAGGVVTCGAPDVAGVLSGAGAGALPGLTEGPGAVDCGLTRALSKGGSARDLPGRCAIPLGLALPAAAFCDPPGSAAAAGQSARLHAMNPSFDPLDVPPVPYQQRTAMAPRTPAPIIRLRAECGRRRSSSFGVC